MSTPLLTYIGGPTLAIEWHGVRLLTDPTLDPAGTEYPTAVYTLHKSAGPAIAVDATGPIDAVLLSHDHHFDNLDRAGRAFLPSARRVLTTIAAAEQLGGHAHGLAPGDTTIVYNATGPALRIAATPARHGPAGGDRGPVIGFRIEPVDAAETAVWVTGDTVWYPDLERIDAPDRVQVIVGFFGAAQVAVAGPHALTLTAADGVQMARHFRNAVIVPVHYEHWAHFTEGRADVQAAFDAAGLSDRLLWLVPGVRRRAIGPPGTALEFRDG